MSPPRRRNRINRTHRKIVFGLCLTSLCALVLLAAYLHHISPSVASGLEAVIVGSATKFTEQLLS